MTTSDELIQRFCDEYHSYHGISGDRRKMQRRVLIEFADFTGRHFSELEGGDVLESFLATQVSGGMAASTVRKHLNAIRPFVKWLWRQRIISADVRMALEDVSPPRGGNNQRPKPYTREQLAVFWREFEEAYPTDDQFDYYLARWSRGTSGWKRVQPYAKRLQMEAIIALALYGGLRREELYLLDIDAMHHENAYVVVRGAAKNHDADPVHRPVPWTCSEMRAAVQDWLDFRATLDIGHDRPWLSLHTEAHYLKPMRFRQFEMLLRNIGRGWEFHRMRHTCATELLRAGNPLETVQRILGHARIQQTLAYAELLPGDVVRTATRNSGEFGAAMESTRA